MKELRKLCHGLVATDTIVDLLDEVGFVEARQEVLAYFVQHAPAEIARIEEATAKLEAFNAQFEAARHDRSR